MCISNSDMENKIASYYKDKSRIELYQARIQMLCRQLEDVNRDIENSNITLHGDIQAIDYSRGKIQTNAAASVQENEIEGAFLLLETQKKNLRAEIIALNTKVRELEKSVHNMDHILNLLSEQARQFVDLRYKNQKSYRYISYKLHVSETSVTRLREAVLSDMSNWIYRFL